MVLANQFCIPLEYKHDWYIDFIKRKDDLDYEMDEIGEDNPSKLLAR